MLGLKLKKMFFLTALCIAAPFLCQAQTGFPWLEKSLEAIKNAKEISGEIESPAISPEMMKKAEEISRRSREHAMAELKQKTPEFLQPAEEKSAEPRILIFTTLGKSPEAARIRTLLEALDGDSHVKIVLQGLPVGMRRLDQMLFFLAEVDDHLEAPPEVLLDPQIFKDHLIKEAPVIMYEDERGNPVAWAKGVTDPEWIRRQVEKGRTGDLGVHGTLEEIAERNLLDEIEERILAVDWEKKKEQAKRRYWEKRDYVNLPPAPKERRYGFSPVHQLKEDFLASDGSVLVPAGSTFNPLDRVPGSFYLVVFDARDDALIEQARKLADLAPGNKRVKYIVTAFNPGEDGWEEKARIEMKLGGRIYFLDKGLSQAFRLEHVPAIVQVEGEKVVIHEHVPTGEAQ